MQEAPESQAGTISIVKATRKSGSAHICRDNEETPAEDVDLQNWAKSGSTRAVGPTDLVGSL